MILSGMKKENSNTYSWAINSITYDPAEAVQTVQYGGYNWKLEIIELKNYKVNCSSYYGEGHVKNVYLVHLSKLSLLVSGTASAGVMPFDNCSCTLKIIKGNQLIWSKEMLFSGKVKSPSSCFAGQTLAIDESTINSLRDNIRSYKWMFKLSFALTDTGSDSNVVKKPQPPFLYSDINKVLKDVETLLQNSDDCNATLVVKGKQFKAHQCILKARVPVFKSMFQANMKERQTGRVVITDCNPVAFQIFLKYIYTGKLDLQTEKNAALLYYIADKYDVPELFKFCLEFMISHWTVSCFFDYINIACNSASNGDKDIFDRLYESGIKFLALNFDSITSSSEWMSYLQENPVGANELVRKAYRCLVHCGHM